VEISNKFTGAKPTTVIPLVSLRSEDTKWKYAPVKHEWQNYSVETNPYVQPPIYMPDTPDAPIRPIPPPPVIVTPPCQRGGQGITPC
jgi:hypothetical protein